MLARPLSLYLHVPFCDWKCTYCDFNSYAGLEGLMPDYTGALVRELELWAPHARGWRVETLFFGGGTPSLLPEEQLTRILEAVARHYDVVPDAEVSLEANPGTVAEGKLREIRALGVNRLSFGVQSFDEGELRFLTRIHSAQEARDAYAAARRAGFDNINLDFIFGLPHQSLASWQRTLREAVRLAPEHLSLYALTVEERTPLGHQVARGLVPEPDPDAAATMYEWTQDFLLASGYEHYEISNWAWPGRRCRHNLTYWENRPYLGVGAGAHSFFLGRRFAVCDSPRRYVRGVGASGPASDPFVSFRQLAFSEEIGRGAEMAETAMLGLRLVEGLELGVFRRRFGVDFLARFGPEVGELVALGLLERAGERIRLTRRGQLLGNEVFLRFIGVAA